MALKASKAWPYVRYSGHAMDVYMASRSAPVVSAACLMIECTCTIREYAYKHCLTDLYTFAWSAALPSSPVTHWIASFLSNSVKREALNWPVILESDRSELSSRPTSATRGTYRRMSRHNIGR